MWLPLKQAAVGWEIEHTLGAGQVLYLARRHPLTILRQTTRKWLLDWDSWKHYCFLFDCGDLVHGSHLVTPSRRHHVPIRLQQWAFLEKIPELNSMYQLWNLIKFRAMENFFLLRMSVQKSTISRHHLFSSVTFWYTHPDSHHTGNMVTQSAPHPLFRSTSTVAWKWEDVIFL